MSPELRRIVTRYYFLEFIFYTFLRSLTRVAIGRKRRRNFFPYLNDLWSFIKVIYNKRLRLHLVKIDGHKFAVFRDRWRDIYLALMHEYELYEYLTSLIKDRGIRTFIDVGANIGTFSLRIAKKFCGISVIAIEPEPTNAYLLRIATKINRLNNLLVIEGAAWHEEVELILRVSEDPATHTVLSTHPLKERRIIGALKVKGVTIDSIVRSYSLKEPILLKVDVEGAEISVIRGARELLRDYEAVIYVEPHLKEHKNVDSCNCALCKELIDVSCKRINSEFNVWASKRFN